MVFPEAEFVGRMGRVQPLMVEAGLDALFLTSEPDFRYFTGFLTRFWESPTRPWFLILPASGQPVAVIPAIGRELMEKTWVADIRTWPAPRPEDDGISLLAATFRDVVGAKARIGVPSGHETVLRMPLADFENLKTALPGCSFADATAVVRSVQEIKSDAEIALIRAICTVGSNAFDRVPEIVRPGRALSSVFRDFQIALLSEGADWVPYVAGGAGPSGYGDVISPASNTLLEPGDILMLDTGAVAAGYFCDFDRNFAVGRADQAARNAYRTLFEATEAGLSAARPGRTAADLYHAMHKVISGAGDAGAVGRLGHGLGMRLTEWPSLTPTDHAELKPGMVITLEPGLQIAPGRMMVHEEDIVIRERGAELLTRRAPPELPVID